MSDAGPVLCKWCLQRLALAGLNSPYCEVCDQTLHPERWKAQYGEPDELGDQREFEHEHRWGADVFAPGAVTLGGIRDRSAPAGPEK
jgi:hypothetical protein